MVIFKLQAVYFLIMGLWPLLNLASFERVTGEKQDTWLAKSIAWLFVVIGLQLLFTGDYRDMAIVGLGSAIVVAGADLYYSLTKRISKVYLLDVVPQFLFIAAWLLYLFS
jgi:hypothetical protein